MGASSDDVEARIRVALNEILGEIGVISRVHRHNDMIYLEIAGRCGLERTAKRVEHALDSIASLLRSAKISIDVTISSPWPWHSQEFARGTPETSGEVAVSAPDIRRRAAR